MAHSKIIISDGQFSCIFGENDRVGGVTYSIPKLNLANPMHREKIKKKINQGRYRDIVYVVSGSDRSHYARVNYNAEKDEGPCEKDQNRHCFVVDYEGYKEINEIVNADGKMREYMASNKLRKHLSKSKLQMSNRVKNGVSKTQNLIQKTFGFLSQYQNLYICPVLPWALDNEVYRAAKELYNGMLQKKCLEGWYLNNGIKLKWLDTKEIYEMSYDALVRSLRRRKIDKIHYGPSFMLRLATYIFIRI